MSNFIKTDLLMKNLKTIETEKIEQNLDILFYNPKKLAAVIKLFYKRKHKSLKVLKAAIHLQKVHGGKYSRIANKWIDEHFEITHNSLVKGDYNQNGDLEAISDNFIFYNIKNVKRGIETETFNKDVENFCINLKNLYNNGFLTKNEKLIQDFNSIMSESANKNQFGLEIYANRKIHDLRFLFLLLQEEKFAKKTEFLLSLEDIKRTKIESRFRKINKRIKYGLSIGFEENTPNKEECTIFDNFISTHTKVDKNYKYLEFEENIEQISDTDEAFEWIL